MIKHTLTTLGLGIALVIPTVADTTASPQPAPSPSYGVPLTGNPPQTRADIWAGIDMRAEPLDVEVLKEWEEDGVVMKVLRYRVGIFKGQKAMMAAVYGYPKGGSKLPGLVQIHGGGQNASHNAVFTNAKRGYATISIAWAGRLSAPDYKVNHDVVKLFWAGKTDDPNHLVTTDWGALDAYHDPSRHKVTNFGGYKPTEWTLDAVESPRNSAWFPCAFAARRALTFLEQQPEVDANRLGVYGHSMGGKLSVLTAGSDERVKAVAPSCGGISDRQYTNPLGAALSDNHYLENITCPIFFLSPSNDFHGRINDLLPAVKEIKTSEWRMTISPHHNHQDTPEYEVATQIWMDHILKGEGALPKTPKTTLALKTKDGVPVLTVEPDASKPVLGVEVYYSREGQMDGKKDDIKNTGSRFWYLASATEDGTVWKASLPLCGVEKPLWVYANVIYGLHKPITGAGYYYGVYTTDRFVLSSLPHLIGTEELKAAGVKSTRTPSLLIEDFQGDWKKHWFTYKPEDWALSTNKLSTVEWKAPAGARLALEVRADQPNTLVVGLDNSAAEVPLQGGANWQSIVLNPADLLDAAKSPLADWSAVRQLRLGADQTLGGKPARKVGGKWQGSPPEFRNLRWITGS
jgi:cephalosporin-C deacetylase-like acetyl esterase